MTAIELDLAKLELERQRIEIDRRKAEIDEQRLNLDRQRFESLDNWKAAREADRPLIDGGFRFADLAIRSLLILNGGAAQAFQCRQFRLRR